MQKNRMDMTPCSGIKQYALVQMVSKEEITAILFEMYNLCLVLSHSSMVSFRKFKKLTLSEKFRNL